MKIWLVIVGVGLVSLLLRSSFLVLWRGQHLPVRITSSLGLVPAAVLAALIAPDLLVSPVNGTFTLLSPRLVAGLLAGVVAWKTRSVLWTLVVGLGVLVLAQALGWR
ncbi:AzlD domain-containing protein [Deinococcus sp. UYEF24]